mmetsp:Transcript_30601/g.63915  ORF Transcript_30601/g.63915 Transcript_30601/m.63915 type:complete len:80 (-) Transcript_30601:466-705(-)
MRSIQVRRAKYPPSNRKYLPITTHDFVLFAEMFQEFFNLILGKALVVNSGSIEILKEVVFRQYSIVVFHQLMKRAEEFS